jgi:glutathione synthase
MGIHIGVVMDPMHSLQFHKDSTIALMMAAQSRGDSLFYIEKTQLYAEGGQAYARMAPVQVFDDEQHWYELGSEEARPLTDLDCILMRQDPPFNMAYVYATYILELAEKAGVLVVNRPSALRDCNEKFYTLDFPELTAPTCVGTDLKVLKAFIAQHRDCIVKPLDGMGGESVFRLMQGDANTNVILETVTQRSTLPCMVQAYLPAISEGDKRILVFMGKPVDHVVVRMPHEGDFRGNIAAGASTSVRPITEAEAALVEKIGPALVKKGLYLVGLDVIGDRISEINSTSPTCLRHIEKATGERVSMKVLTMIDTLLSAR